MLKTQKKVTERIMKEARHIIETGATIRETAIYFLNAKSTTHLDVTERLEGVDPEMAIQVRAVLDRNKGDRHLRGGAQTKQRWAEKRKAEAEEMNSVLP